VEGQVLVDGDPIAAEVEALVDIENHQVRLQDVIVYHLWE